jgi:hypothetical protein
MFESRAGNESFGLEITPRGDETDETHLRTSAPRQIQDLNLLALMNGEFTGARGTNVVSHHPRNVEGALEKERERERKTGLRCVTTPLPFVSCSCLLLMIFVQSVYTSMYLQ